jgi:hypothetical protein
MSEQIIDHEVRIRLLEKIAEGIDRRFDKLESKMDSQFHWVLGTILTLVVTVIALFGGVIFAFL